VLTDAVIEHLRASGEFSTVSAYNGRPDNDYILSGKLDKLEEVDYEGRVKVVVAMSAQITKVKTGATVWNGTVSKTGTVPQANVAGVVAQMNRTMELAINELLATVPTSIGSRQ